MTQVDPPKPKFPYSYPVYLSPVLRCLLDGKDHRSWDIRQLMIKQLPLTLDEQHLLHRNTLINMFVNRVGLALAKLVQYKLIVKSMPGPFSSPYRITDYGRAVYARQPENLREPDLRPLPVTIVK